MSLIRFYSNGISSAFQMSLTYQCTDNCFKRFEVLIIKSILNCDYQTNEFVFIVIASLAIQSFGRTFEIH